MLHEAGPKARRALGTRALAAVLAAAALAGGACAPAARADGDPGSDVLVYQPLFVTSGAGVSVSQQVALGRLLRASRRAGFPVRVAIVAHRSDLGAVTALWGRPRAYARFLGTELSLAYRQRLLVVMPNGLGFEWHGHPSAPAYRTLSAVSVGPGGEGLATAVGAAVRRLASAAGVKLPAAGRAADVARDAAARGGVRGADAADAESGGGGGGVPLIPVAIVALLAIAFAVRFALRRRRRRHAQRPARPPAAAVALRERFRAAPEWARWGARAVALVAALTAAGVTAIELSGSHTSSAAALATNPYLDPGTSLSRRPAADFTLADQFGRRVSLSSFRGKVVILAFDDSECLTVCPLTTTAMVDAKRLLGPAGSRVQLLGVDANPKAIGIEDVRSYSAVHGMLRQWRFLTGSLPQLRRVWRDYGVAAQIRRGLISHTPALFVIDPQGRLAKVYMTQMSYAAVGQLGQLLARDAASLLPGHPPVRSSLSYATIPGIGPGRSVALPRAGGGRLRLGPGKEPRLLAFFATWDRQSMGIGGMLEKLAGYRAAAGGDGARAPRVVAVDEGSVEPSPQALPRFLRTLSRPLPYQVAIDRGGRVADGYQVQGLPWLVLTSASGRILWYDDVSTQGWPSRRTLVRDVRAALSKARTPPPQGSGARHALAGSPAPLAALHRQANRLLDSQSGLMERVRALRGYPLVVNAWASWCTPCKRELPLLASAALRYGRRVAFLGADVNDSADGGRSFLAEHPLSYPSYTESISGLSSLAAIPGLPTTIFIGRDGRVAHVHPGQYDSEGGLDADIEQYALGGGG